MSSRVVDIAIEKYGLVASRNLPDQKGYRNYSYPVQLNDGRIINFIVYKNEPGISSRIRRADKVSNYLADGNFPARQSFDSRLVLIKAGGQTRHGGIYGYLPGHTIPWEAYTKDHLKLAGQYLGLMHEQLRAFPAASLPDVENECLTTLNKMSGYFNSTGVTSAMSQKLSLKLSTKRIDLYNELIIRTKTLPARQALHMDFVRGNILFDTNPKTKKTYVSGVLDFEKVAQGIRLFDIARTLSFLRIDCKYKNSAEINRYFLSSGYVKRGGQQLKPIVFTYKNRKIDLLETLVEFFWLHDFYKFLKHNPYESLEFNEHYHRTREALLSRGVVTFTG